MKLFDFLNEPASSVEHVNILVNGEWKGVFLQVEQVDENFLNRINVGKGSLYKGVAHGANMSPIFNDDYFHYNWEPKIQYQYSDQELKLFLNKLYFLDGDHFNEEIIKDVDILNVINYFAVMFSISSLDNFTKNYYLYKNMTSHQFKIFPWDNDAAYGNIWTGEYQSWLEHATNFNFLNKQVLFRRLMEYPSWRKQFEQSIQLICTEGFQFLTEQIDSVSNIFLPDYFLDEAKKGNNSSVEKEISQLKQFLNTRKDILNVLVINNPNRLQHISMTTNEYDSQFIRISVRSDAPQRVFLNLICGLDSKENKDPYEVERVELIDNGEFPDNIAGDLIYESVIDRSKLSEECIPIILENENGLPYPWNGEIKINIPSNRTICYSINNIGRLPLNGNLEFKEVLKEGSLNIVELSNLSDEEFDISGSFVKLNNDYQAFYIPETTIIMPSESIFISNDLKTAINLLPNRKIIGNFSFDINNGDEISLYNGFNEIITKQKVSLAQIDYSKPPIVINEIFYNSNEDYNSDWIELFNNSSKSVDLSNWTFLDELEDHSFTLPKTTIGPKNFLVLCRDLEKFHIGNPEAFVNIGSFNFNLNSKGELIRLKDHNGITIDSVRYDNQAPWPEESDGMESSIELLNPNLDNNNPINWKYSSRNGTPGRTNSVADSLSPNESIQNSFTVYPNPFLSKLNIFIEIPYELVMQVSIIDEVGKRVFYSMRNCIPGEITFSWEPKNAPSGLYYISVTIDDTVKLFAKSIHLQQN